MILRPLRRVVNPKRKIRPENENISSGAFLEFVRLFGPRDSLQINAPSWKSPAEGVCIKRYSRG
jgi:hypothetical protein